MAVFHHAIKLRLDNNNNTENNVENDEPVSPTGQYFNSKALSINIVAVFESQIPLDDSPTYWMLENVFLPVHPRFSSVMIKDEHGVQQWKKVQVNLKDHINIPTFPTSQETYEDHLSNYLTKIAMEKLPQNKPLWDLHIIKYPTKNAQGAIVFRLHHALGDGFSLMGALFSCVQRADNPSLPLTFPKGRSRATSKDTRTWRVVARALSMCVNTVRDFGWSLLKSNFIEDDKSGVRSGVEGVEFKPIDISTISFSLDHIRHIKNKLGGTINDVICGIIFYGIQLYLQAEGPLKRECPQVTALVLLNTRIIANYQNPSEMIKPNANTQWGNQFGFLHVSMPNCKDIDKCDPLSFIIQARNAIKAKRNSLAVHLTGTLLETLRKLLGHEHTANYLHSTLSNTSMTISNLTGPIEQMIIAGHPINNFYFMVVGVPQSLTITVVTYMGKLIVALGTEKGFVNSKLLLSCMVKSFDRIFENAVVNSSN